VLHRIEPISRSRLVPVERPALRMRWEALTYLHWDLDPDVVAERLPADLEPDLHDCRAYVGLIPFRMARIGIGPLGVPLPQGRFPETNVRTYVVGPDGGRGVYFQSSMSPVWPLRSSHARPTDCRTAGRGWGSDSAVRSSPTGLGGAGRVHGVSRAT
jgi:hypothetical protein